MTDAKQTVLAVDDESAVLRLVRRMLELSGFAVVTATGGRDAIEAFSRNPSQFCCVLLDLSMPDVPGETVLGELRRVDAEIPIVVTSGYPPNDQRGHPTLGEHISFLQKPWRREQLVEAIERMSRARPELPN